MLMKYCEDHTILDMAYLDPTMVTEALVMKYMWIMWDEIYSLLKGDELGAQIICLWEL
jgi:hypothetical protein